MPQSASLQQGRRITAAGMILLSGSGLLWFLTPGLPVWWGPSASAAAKAEGRALFVHEWEPNDPLAHGDGLGPVFNAKSCVACHFQGGVGGGGLNSANVMTFEVVPTLRDPHLHQGVLHSDAIDPAYQETGQDLGRLFPVIPGGTRVVSGCTTTVQDFNPVQTQMVNTSALFGAGWIDRISSHAISHHQLRHALANTAKEFALEFDTIPAGKVRILPDGRVGRFGWKAQFATLEEFVAAACANELGLGTPLKAQPKPLGNPGYPEVAPDLDRSQFKSLTAFVATLPRPVETMPTTSAKLDAVDRGKKLFTSIGCAVCHTPDPGGVTGVYSDFLLHDLENHGTAAGSYAATSSAELPRPTDDPSPSEWRTPPLWGVADSAPYFHDGGSNTLLSAIVRHHGDAELVRKAFEALSAADRQALITFLTTLKAPPDAEPVASN